MKIVHIARTVVAGAPRAIADALNRFTEHESVFISQPHFRFQPHIPVMSRLKAIEAVRKADVIHCHGNFVLEDTGTVTAYLAKHVRKNAQLVYQAHSSRKELPLKKLPSTSKYKCLVIAQGWSRHYPSDWTLVPNIIFTEDMELIPFKHRERVICYTPSNRFCNDPRYGQLNRPEKPNPKGWEYTLRALRGLPLKIYESLPVEECLCKKADAVLAVDEVVTPMYHRSGLEFLALGVPCIESFDERSESDLLKITGAKKNPFIRATPKNLRNIVEEWYTDRDRCRERAAEVREWMLKYWTAEEMIKRFVEIYKSL